jgi:hypothetical protein
MATSAFLPCTYHGASWDDPAVKLIRHLCRNPNCGYMEIVGACKACVKSLES